MFRVSDELARVNEVAVPNANTKHRFPRAMRLNSPLRFRQLYTEGASVSRGVIKCFGARNGLEKPRLGISIGRRVGTAARRNLIKRRLREAFRLMQHDWPMGYDLVIVVRPHAPLPLAEYQRAMSGAMVRLVSGSDAATQRSGDAAETSMDG